MSFGSRSEESAQWEVIASTPCYDSPHLTVVAEEIRTPSRPQGQSWIIAQRKAAVIIAPLTAEGKLVLIRQERIPIRSAIWEVPGGQIDDRTATDAAAIEAVALRELQEETGYHLAPDGELVPLGHYYSSPGFTDELGYHFLARPVELSAAGHAHEESETILDCRAFTAEEISRMIRENEIRDANTLSICAKLVARGEFVLHI